MNFRMVYYVDVLWRERLTYIEVENYSKLLKTLFVTLFVLFVPIKHLLVATLVIIVIAIKTMVIKVIGVIIK